jgi:hypothetical protein
MRPPVLERELRGPGSEKPTGLPAARFPSHHAHDLRVAIGAST